MGRTKTAQIGIHMPNLEIIERWNLFREAHPYLCQSAYIGKMLEKLMDIADGKAVVLSLTKDEVNKFINPTLGSEYFASRRYRGKRKKGIDHDN